MVGFPCSDPGGKPWPAHRLVVGWWPLARGETRSAAASFFSYSYLISLQPLGSDKHIMSLFIINIQDNTHGNYLRVILLK